MIVQNRERLEGASSQAALSGETQDTSPRIAPIYEQKLTQARSAVTQDPKRVAQVIKTWVNADG
jgi:flagellar biosynthesis/type III secretory pathway M-ring protein FliF/YscJ